MQDDRNGSSERPWVGVTANPGSGAGRGRIRVEQFRAVLADRGLDTLVAWTPADRRALVRQAEEDPRCRCLVAVGGDGTVAALINERPTVPMTVLPTGTENLFARHFGMSPEPRRAADTIERGRSHRIDLGSTPDSRFALMAGIGFDADVVTRHHRSRVARSGRAGPTHRAAYVEPVLRSSLEYRFPKISATIHDPPTGEVLEGRMAFVFNLPRYALGLPIAPNALEDDGRLDLIMFPRPGPFQALWYLWEVVRGRHLHGSGAVHRRVRSAEFVADEPVPVQLDGDPAGIVPGVESGRTWTVEALPGAIELLVPRSYRVATADAPRHDRPTLEREIPSDPAGPIGRPGSRKEAEP